MWALLKPKESRKTGQLSSFQAYNVKYLIHLLRKACPIPLSGKRTYWKRALSQRTYVYKSHSSCDTSSGQGHFWTWEVFSLYSQVNDRQPCTLYTGSRYGVSRPSWPSQPNPDPVHIFHPLPCYLINELRKYKITCYAWHWQLNSN